MRTAQISSIDGSSWDAIVIGAGPAGSVAAYRLASSGMRTLHIDRRRFPRTKVCGGYINGRSLRILERIGLGQVIGSLSGERISTLRVRSGRGPALTLTLPGSLAVSRSIFDAALAGAAAGAGATFLDGVSAEVAERPTGLAGPRVVNLSSPDGSVCSVSGRVIVAADGLGHPALHRLPEFQCSVVSGSRIGAGTVIEDTASQFPPGVIHMAVGREGYVGLVRVGCGSLNIACAINPEFLRLCGGPAKGTEQILIKAGFPVPEQLTAAAWQGTVPLSRRTARPAGWRILLIGDATGYIEPFTGEGIAWALSDGASVSQFVHRGLADWTSRLEEDWTGAHHRLVVRHQWLCRTLAVALRSPALVHSWLGICSRFPSLASALIRRMNTVPEGLPG